jgi:hypothetical protein
MRALSAGLGVFWVLCLGAVVLYAFFAVLGAFDPGEVMWLTIAVGVLGLACVIHFIRIRRALGDGRHEDLARRVHAMRETRGF